MVGIESYKPAVFEVTAQTITWYQHAPLVQQNPILSVGPCLRNTYCCNQQMFELVEEIDQAAENFLVDLSTDVYQVFACTSPLAGMML